LQRDSGKGLMVVLLYIMYQVQFIEKVYTWVARSWSCLFLNLGKIGKDWGIKTVAMQGANVLCE
jgi:hypothetical protein